MSSTEGSGGGAPLVLSKEPVERPVVLRGPVIVDLMPGEHPEIGKPFTFQATNDGFRLTYHNVTVDGVSDHSAQVYVGKKAVVTWEKVDAQ